MNNPKRAGDLERIVLEQKKVSACPPNQIMDFLILGQFKNFPKIEKQKLFYLPSRFTLKWGVFSRGSFGPNDLARIPHVAV